MKLIKIISGGQTGVDQAGLRAGRALGLETGGWVPRGWLTLDGPAPWLADYGLSEYPSVRYVARTYANVRDSDATIRLARNFGTGGEICTLRAINEHKKPHFDVLLGLAPPTPVVVQQLIDFLISHGVRVLNVAGNSERSAPGIGLQAERFLIDTLRRHFPVSL